MEGECGNTIVDQQKLGPRATGAGRASPWIRSVARRAQVFDAPLREGPHLQGQLHGELVRELWDVAFDVEVEREDVASHLWTLSAMADGSGSVRVATTRPETMLGDTAVA